MTYGADLAFVHDAGHGDFARAAAPVVLELLRRVREPAGRIVDLGCGSGILARQLLDAGYQVTGIDQSEAMIAIARQRAPEADLRVASFLDAELPACVAVTAIGECFSYLFDEEVAGAGLDRLLERIHAALEPGGLLIFDVAGPGRVRGASPQRNWRASEDWALLIEAEESGGSLTRRIVTFRRTGELWRRSFELHRLRLWSRSELGDRLRAVGFRVQPLRGYGPARFFPGQFGLVARKRRLCG